MSIRIFFSVDVHGATSVWRKWIRAAESYKANVLMFCGDLAGKALVPIIKNSNYRAHYFGKKWNFDGEGEIKEFERKLEDVGIYSARLSETEVEELKANEQKLEKLINDKIVQRFDTWLSILTSTLDTTEKKTIVMPGNDDSFSIDSVIQKYESEGIINPIDKIVKLNGIEIISIAHVPPTPWNTPRETDEKKIGKIIKNLVVRLSDPNKSIFNFHSPPYNTRLDLAPEIGKNRKPVIVGGHVNMIHVGSKAIRQAIENYQPLLGLHGHIHESSGAEKIGRTVIINPGSEYGEGVLRAFIIEISNNYELNYWRVER